MIIGDTMEYITVLLRTLIFYTLITLIYRVMGKREVGQLGVVDLTVSILIAELAAISIENHEETIWLSILPMLLLAGIEILLAYISLKSSKVRDLFDGKPSVIINRGIINFKEMIKQRYNVDDLLTQLRQQKIKSIESVDYAILETSGKLSIFEKSKSMHGDYPLPLILDGKIQYDTLKQLKKDKKWLEHLLEKEHVTLEEVFYGFWKDKALYMIRMKDLQDAD